MNLTPTVKGMALMMVATVSFNTMQAGIRVVASDPVNPIPAVEVAFFRNLFGLLVLAPMLLRVGVAALATQRIRLHLLRAAFQSVGMLCFFVGITLIPLSEATTLSFSAPLFATILAIVVLGERVRMRRISALVIGFVGVLLVLRPRVESMSLGAALILISSLAWAVSMTIIKSLSRTESALTLTVYAALFMSPIVLIPSIPVWENPSLVQLGWLFGVGGVGSVGHMAFAQAFKIAEMSAVLPLDFLRLLWASACGYWLFAEVPSGWSWAGGVIVFSAATYIAFREAKLGRDKRRA